MQQVAPKSSLRAAPSRAAVLVVLAALLAPNGQVAAISIKRLSLNDRAAHIGIPNMTAASAMIVNSVGDEPDSGVGDGHCDTDGNLSNGDQCTLRAAIQEVNPTAANEISFSLPPHSTIVLTSELDALTGMTINGPGSNLLTITRSTAVGTPDFRILTVGGPAVVQITGLTITNGRGSKGADGDFGGNGAPGGGVSNSGDLRLVDVVVVDNRAGAGGQGYGQTPGGSGGAGGGIFSSGRLTLIDCLISGNKAGDGGSGGTGNDGGRGGGIAASSGVTMIDTTVSNNTAGGGGNGGLNGTAGPAGRGGTGGGISLRGSVSTIINTTMSGNRSGRGGNGPGLGGANGGDGGGIENYSRLTMINSTISDNATAEGGNGTRGGDGGGIWNSHPQMIVANSTISGNRTTGFYGGWGGGIYSRTSFEPILKNSIIANNAVSTGGASDGVGPDVAGTVDSRDYNLIENPAGASFTGATAHNILGVDPKLGPLANNGGSIQTHGLLPGSPAIDAASNSNIEKDELDLDNDADTTEAVPVDSRGVGFPRVVNGTVDIGAFEGTLAAGPLQLLLDLSGPAADQAAALSSVSFLRDPFRVMDDSSVNSGSDRNARVIIFVANLQLEQGQAASAIVVNLIASNAQSFDIAAENARPLTNLDVTQVTFRLPDNLPAGTCILKVKAHGQTSNAGTIRIRI